jgi:hypothetical protein
LVLAFSPAARRRSYELLAEAFGLTAPDDAAKGSLART